MPGQTFYFYGGAHTHYYLSLTLKPKKGGTMIDNNKITEDDFLQPISKLKGIAALLADRNEDLTLLNDACFGVKWILDDIANEFQSICNRWLKS